MKLCKNCQNPIPAKILIEGHLKRTASSRNVCFQCRPLGCHNHRTPIYQQLAEPKGFKICNDCKKLKPISDFQKTRLGTPQPYCRACCSKQKKLIRNEIKKRCIEYKGGKCFICQYDRCYTSLHFHHIQQSQKDFSISRKPFGAWEEIKKELDKCILVCSNCHGELHEGKIKLPPQYTERESVVG